MDNNNGNVVDLSGTALQVSPEDMKELNKIESARGVPVIITCIWHACLSICGGSCLTGCKDDCKDSCKDSCKDACKDGCQSASCSSCQDGCKSNEKSGG